MSDLKAEGSGQLRRLALGTVQFGLEYGVANRTGRVEVEQMRDILGLAHKAEIDTLDTAISYGQCEQRLGEIGIHGWQVVSKLPALPDQCDDILGWVRASVQGSLRRLAIPRLSGLLLHRPRELLGANGVALHRALCVIRELGEAEKIGVSIYDPEDLELLWPRYALDLVQAPFNVLDRRLVSSGWLARLHDGGVEIHVRSVFLQGLLLMQEGTRPRYFDRWQSVWERWQRWLASENVSALRAALGCALAQRAVGRVVVGVDSVGQLRDILAAGADDAADCPDQLGCSDPELINPSMWRLQ
jgi:aryl-alcohol dehydrogenase-like predicted oxidoreductase